MYTTEQYQQLGENSLLVILLDRRWHLSTLDVRFSGQLTVILITIYQEEVNGGLKSRNACYHLVQNILSTILLSPKYKSYDTQNDEGVLINP